MRAQSPIRPADTSERIRRAFWRAVPHAVYLMLGESLNLWYCLRKIGVRGWWRLYTHSAGHGRSLAPVFSMEVPGFEHPVFLRENTSDIPEFVHTIIRDGYGRSLPKPPVRTIIDAGANIGDTTVWYLNRFPDAQVAAIEPDSENYAMLQRNTGPYGARVMAKRAGLWSSAGALATEAVGGYSGRAVRAAERENDANVTAITIPMLMEELGWNRIDIFKCDIEGAELNVFAGPCPWLDKVRVLYVETHGSAAEAQVLAAVSSHGFSVRTYRELLICSRPDDRV